MKRRALMAVATLTLLACGGRAQLGETDPDPESPSEPPEDWQIVHARCGFSFRAPSEFSEVAVQGTDSCVVQYDSPSCSISGDAGWYSDPLTWTASEAQYAQRSLTVDGRSATLVTFRFDPPRPYWAAIHVPDVVGDGSQTKLTVSAQCAAAAGRDELVTSLESIRFE